MRQRDEYGPQLNNVSFLDLFSSPTFVVMLYRSRSNLEDDATAQAAAATEIAATRSGAIEIACRVPDYTGHWSLPLRRVSGVKGVEHGFDARGYIQFPHRSKRMVTQGCCAVQVAG